MSIGIIAALVIGLVSAFLWYRRDYEDGLIGHIALAGMCGIALLMMVKASVDAYYSIPPELTVMLVCVALFMSRHAYRFYLWRRTGKNSWAKKDSAHDALYH